ncbi:fructosamine kinase family protein [Mucilaginibacter robiniae]|uniref:Fructosamine kinase family protein n=1 Tax=Mucilaginibacter robiniae TaxID=2728022 RepID=A0A7L5EB38_9SPHI|nr:fructosamine kinase family protein [Mucilaginibacter robiniae]QJD98163.1 fructosamine kinase family protein [Mucilaginibacter robiniae]
MAISRHFTTHLAEQLSAIHQRPVQLTSVSPISGGDINEAYCLHTNTGKYMMKLNSKQAYPGMFACESEGLNAIQSTQTIAVPEVVLQSDFEQDSYLILEWIDATHATPATSRKLGEQLAAMHRHTAGQFGFHQDNYMGSLPQSNRKHDTWRSFFIEERLQPMVQRALNKRLLQNAEANQFEQLYLHLGDWFEEEVPALIHGDLWGGNYLIGADGKPYLIDPAVSYGHREFDLAMTTLFGGYSREFYEGYQNTFPLAQDWEQRSHLWNLYPLLLHLNLFGLGYLSRVKDCLKKYV